ncbi:MAG TPA: dienelactone hydrolase family protein [Propionibacteriaceae bacterium]|nr:dienelactone hydrolase family protein [Propionibacteriaceae bacterium]
MPEDTGDYLVEPAGQAAAGVLVVHDWYGLLPHVRAACDDLAAAGLVALAADLYAGRTATDPAQAEALAEGMDRPAARTRLDEAVATLRDRSGGGPVGVLGWSLGGMHALVQATKGAIDAAAIYYAALDQEDAAKIHCPVLLHLAEVDEFDPPEFYEGFVTALRANGTEVTVHTWPGTEHSFANRDVALHTPDAAAKAWSITTGFLRDRLTGATAG